VNQAGNVKSDKKRIPLSSVVFNQQRYSPLNFYEFFLMEQPLLKGHKNGSANLKGTFALGFRPLFFFIKNFF
jgi:hypothetical protein